MLGKLFRVFLFSLVLIGTGSLSAQNFSDDPDKYIHEARGFLHQLNTEAANKVAFDLMNAWRAKFKEEHKEKILQISEKMRRKGYPLRPYYWHFFSYLAYSVEQEGIMSDQLNQVLDINLQVISTLSEQEYADFLFTLNVFFGRRYLFLERTSTARAPGGTYRFELLNAPEVIEEEVVEEEPVEEEEFITEEELQQTEVVDMSQPAANDPWSQPANDPWDQPANDPWSQPANDPWDSGNSDPWATSNDDPWATNSDDTWNSDDPWGTTEEETAYVEPAPVRQQVVPVIEDFVATLKSKYVHPALDGPVIHLDDVALVVSTPYDTLRFTKVKGAHLLGKRTFVGKQAELEWPGRNEDIRGAKVELAEFSMRVDRGELWTPNAKMKFPAWFAGEVEGAFRFKSIKRPKRALSTYPVFSSYKGGIKLDFPNGKATYKGGLEVQGNQVFGAAVSKELGELTILDGKGQTAIFRAERFTFNDSIITSDQASLTILHGDDSIYHPSVEMEYRASENKVMALRKKSHSVTPFHSTYFEMSMNADLLRWDMTADSLNLNILNGKDLVPATFESDDYFNELRYKRLTGYFGFHPIAISVHYCNKFGIKEFYTEELVNEYNVTQKMVEGAMRMLERYNFCDFDERTGHVSLFDNAFHYYESSAKRKDYDNLFIPSISPYEPNGTLSFGKGELRVHGAKKFFLTSDFAISVEPENEQVVLEEGRGLKYNGAIDAGDFNYKGKDFEFDYDEYLVRMPTIDSIRIQIPLKDSLHTHGEKETLNNHLTGTSGTLYLNRPDNKSGLDDTRAYPYFVTDSEAIVYFDGPEVLNGAYDKSVKFIIPPLEVDSIDREDAETITFPGRFNSGGIFPEFEDTLHIQEDRSLGFVHDIPPEGYNLYGTPARTYEQIRLSNEGMRGGGKIDFLSSTIYSDDFIYYPDSVTADGHVGSIGPGTINEASYPEAEMTNFRMYWLPRKDSMYLKTTDEPFNFYGGTASLTGEANITTNGVYGSGTMLTRGSRALSNELNFQEFEYSARHSRFEVLTDDPEKPAMEGDDIRLNFDLQQNVADVSPEVQGVAAISFPYAQMKTSITNAVWDLEDSIITMTKPPEVDIINSYFYSTRPELDSLAFNAEKAVYDIQTYELQVQGIPYIQVADAQIVPKNNETTILANSVLQTFEGAEIIFENETVYHYLFDATVDIESRNDFTGNATYLLPVQQDTFEIKFFDFSLEERQISEDYSERTSVAQGEVRVNQNLDIAPGFLYKGGVTLRAYKQALELDGFVKMNLESLSDEQWIQFQRQDEETNVIINVNNATYEDEDPFIAGLHYDAMGRLYPTFSQKRQSPSDDDVFLAKGLLSYSEEFGTFKIEDAAKTSGESYQGSTFMYADSSTNIIFEGLMNFINPDLNKIKVISSVLGTGNKEKSEYELDGFFILDYSIPFNVVQIMSRDILDIVERLGNPVANDLSIESMLKLANIVGDETTKTYETESLKEYTPLFGIAEPLNRTMVISGVKMKWSDKHRAWHNTTKLALSNMLKQDINAKVDGFMEFKKDESGADVLNLFIQAAPGTWYYFGYQDNNLLVHSSNRDFNEKIEQSSNYGKAKPGEMVLVAGDENETLSFVNDFREKYFGIKEPFNLVYPDDAELEDELFQTIEEDPEEEDDGFGF